MKITKEICLNEALKYNTKSEFHNKARKFFDYAKENGIFDEVTKHMFKYVQPSLYTLEDAKSLAKTVKSIKEFKEKNKSLYNWVHNHGYKDEIFGNLEITGNRYKRCVYVYELEDKHCYVGLTYNIKKRDIEHRYGCYSAVLIHCNENNIKIPEPKQLTEYLPKDEASRKEIYFVELYKQNGWVLLNRIKAGGLGGNYEDKTRYSKESCKQFALNFENRREVELANRYLYHKVLSHGWDDYVFSHMNRENIEKKRREKIRQKKLGVKMNVTHEEWMKAHKSQVHPILQLDKETKEVIKEYETLAEASRDGFTFKLLKNACKNGIEYNGFYWKYKEK